VFHESLEITISSNNVQLKFKDKVKTIEKEDISAIYIYQMDKKERQSAMYLEHKQVVILGKYSNELYREIIDVKDKLVRDAFPKHGYPWVNEDSFADAYER
jgi:hypothetical protein